MTVEVPYPRTDLSHDLSDRYAERGVAIQDGYADLEFSDLTVEVPRQRGAAPAVSHNASSFRRGFGGDNRSSFARAPDRDTSTPVRLRFVRPLRGCSASMALRSCAVG